MSLTRPLTDALASQLACQQLDDLREARNARKLCAYHIADSLEYGEDEATVIEVDERDCQQCEANYDRAHDDGRDFTAPYEP